jgi:hypothetical protein
MFIKRDSSIYAKAGKSVSKSEDVTEYYKVVDDSVVSRNM